MIGKKGRNKYCIYSPITGYGPMGNQIVTFTTKSVIAAGKDSMGRNTKLNSMDNMIDNQNTKGSTSGTVDDVNPIVLYAIFGVGAGIILVLVIGVIVVLRYKCQAAPANDPRSNKSYR